mmetsp:Transcript_21995/g.37749  ORF Transcript_21995/g.37749 Transcript_21995/m.37749 type:complete len:83 (-) Transcript_21995:134-382(-)
MMNTIFGFQLAASSLCIDTRLAMSCRSVTGSRQLVASSKINISGRRISARAMAILCFCPPDKWAPLAPSWVLYPWGNSRTKP